MRAQWTRRELLAAGAMGLVSVLGAGCGGGGTKSTTATSRERLLYSSQSGNAGGLYLINSDGSGKQRLTNPMKDASQHVRVDDIQAKPLTDGSGRIVFMRALLAGDMDTEDVYRCDLYIVNRDGSNLRQIVEDVSKKSTYAISPDNSTILYVPKSTWWRDSREKPEIYTVPISGGVGHPLTEGFNPSYSPDGSTVLFERYTLPSASIGGYWGALADNLFLVNADGSNERALTTGLDWHTEGKWAPDGSRIGFRFRAADESIVTNPLGHWYGINPDGTGKGPADLLRPEFPQRLFPSEGNYRLEIGKYLPPNYLFDIYRINADGSEQNITNQGYVREALWLP